MMIRTLRGEKMSEDGMHKNVGGPKSPLTQPRTRKMTIGFSGIRGRAKLSNAIGYGAKEVPRISRGKSRITDREKLI